MTQDTYSRTCREHLVMIRLFLLVEGTHEGKELEASKTLKPWGLLRVMTYNKTQDCTDSSLYSPGFFLY